jgi:hypothetical protein
MSVAGDESWLDIQGWLERRRTFHVESDGVGPERTQELRELFLAGELAAYCSELLQGRTHSELSEESDDD